MDHSFLMHFLEYIEVFESFFHYQYHQQSVLLKREKNDGIKNDMWVISPVAKNNVTILSSTHCSAPGAWPLQSNIIGFSQFWRKLLIFRTRNIYKIERPFIKKYLRF